MNIETLKKVCTRFDVLRVEAGHPPGDRQATIMDLESADEQFDMDWGALLGGSKVDAGHDLFGIERYMDRSTYPGVVKGEFVPRFTRKQDLSACCQGAISCDETGQHYCKICFNAVRIV